MKFPYLVKHDGVYYPAGTEVPIETGKGGEKPPVAKVSGKVDEEKPVKEEVKTDSDSSAKKYAEEDLNLPYMKLKALAKKEGFKVPNTAKADDIKEMLRGIV